MSESLEKKYQQLQKTNIDLFELGYDDIPPDEWSAVFPIYEELTSITEQYTLPEKIAEGGMKIIYRVRDNSSGRFVAKAILKQYEDLSARERFLREARIGASLQHPNILPVYDIGVDSNGEPFFIMELLEGETLADVIKKHYSSVNDDECQLSKFDLIDYYLKICDAVSYAHSQGILHLDLKPDNIYINTFGQVHLCDWGLSVRVNEQDDDLYPEQTEVVSNNMTLCGKIKGTPGFMAPEQYRELDTHDERTDVFALGSILYSLLTGKVAIPGNTFEDISRNTCEGQIKSPNDLIDGDPLSSSLEAVIMKSLNIDKTDRYQSVEELKEDLNSYLRGYATMAENPSFLTLLRLLISRNKRLACTIFTAAIVYIISTMLFLFWIDNERTRALDAKREADSSRIVAEENLLRFKEQQLLTDVEREKNEQLLINTPLSEDHRTVVEAIDNIEKALVAAKSDAIKVKLIQKLALLNFSIQHYELAVTHFQRLKKLPSPLDQFYNWSLKFSDQKQPHRRIGDKAFAKMLAGFRSEATDYIELLYTTHMNKETGRSHIPEEYAKIAQFMIAYINNDWKNLYKPLKLSANEYGRHLDLSYSKVSQFRTSGVKGWNVLIPLQLSSLDLSYTHTSGYTDLIGLSLKRLNVTGCQLRPHHGSFPSLLQIVDGTLIVSKGAYSKDQLSLLRKKIAVKEVAVE